MDCDKLVGGFPDLHGYCRQDGLATAEMVDVCFGDLVVGLHEQDLVPKLRGCCLESKRDGGQLSPVAAVLALAVREEPSSLVGLAVSGPHLVPPPPQPR